MTLAELVLGLMVAGLTAYALLAGADFGAGFWDLFAGGAEKGARQRALMEHSIGPVWEANHVWLIFALVVLWTGFPEVFAAITSTLYIPLTVAGLGVILRGSGFAFRKAVEEVHYKRIFGATFALSSVLTPFFLGTVVGAVASGRVSLGSAGKDPIGSWLNPTSVLCGIFSVAVCAYLAAVYLTADATRSGDRVLAEQFRTRALWSGAATGLVSVAGIVILNLDAPLLFEGLTGRGLALLPLSLAGGVATLWFVWRRRYIPARIAAGLAVGGVLWGWAAGQYPYMPEGTVTIEQAASSPATLRALLLSLAVGAVLVVPGLIWLFVLFQRAEKAEQTRGEPVLAESGSDGSGA